MESQQDQAQCSHNSWAGIWECKCGHPNNEHDVAEFEKDGELFIQCKECPNVINVKDVPPFPSETFFWQCRACHEYNDAGATRSYEKDGRRFVECNACKETEEF